MKQPHSSKAVSEKIARLCIAVVSYLMIGIVVALVGYLVIQGIGPLGRRIFQAIPVCGSKTLLQIWFQTVRVLLGATLIAVPLGMGAGIYLSEYAPDTRTMQNIIDSIISLAEVPPIVYGLFGWGALSLYRGVDQTLTVVMLASGIWLMPRVVMETYAALQEIPVSYRRESLALGASPWQTTWNAVLSSAKHQLAIGVLRAMARVSGEAAPIIVIAASQQGVGTSSSTILPYYLYRCVIESFQGGREAQFATALLLFATSLLLHSIAILIQTTKVTPEIGTDYRGGGRWW